MREQDFEVLRVQFRRILFAPLMCLWILWFFASVVFLPFIPSAIVLWFFTVRSLQQTVFFVDRILSQRLGYFAVQGYLHERLPFEKPRSKTKLFLMSLYSFYPFYSCRISELSKWKRRQRHDG